jgi:hypothetical protein
MVKRESQKSTSAIILGWREYYIYATEKTTNNTPIAPYITYTYHPIPQFKSWWYTINLSR